MASLSHTNLSNPKRYGCSAVSSQQKHKKHSFVNDFHEILYMTQNNRSMISVTITSVQYSFGYILVGDEKCWEWLITVLGIFHSEADLKSHIYIPLAISCFQAIIFIGDPVHVLLETQCMLRGISLFQYCNITNKYNIYRIMYGLEWWTVYAPMRGLFWCLLPKLQSNKGNRHWKNHKWWLERWFSHIDIVRHFLCLWSGDNVATFSALLALCVGNSPGPRWIPRTKASDLELWCFLWSAPE